MNAPHDHDGHDDHDPNARPHTDGDSGPDETLAALQAAFHALTTPDPTPALSNSDATTQAVVNWMCAAMDHVALPPRPVRRPSTSTDAESAEEPASVYRLPRWQRPELRRSLATAATFAAFALALWWARVDSFTQDAGSEFVALQSGGSVADRPQPVLDAPGHSTASSLEIPGFRAAAEGSSGLVASTNDHLEVSSGPVRLVLLTSSSGFAP